ncbi:relaxase/mobilization nuclease domain-containing protein [Fundidesulfovibrio putealis]|uniref:relaxase/mobilization nuclease domain-containing protein n=1 Tax=Fundidesulfovibrio putealis TaxID=270496 RepID=UPI000408A992|nr:relaxase/mobilization nuclease domain-containing protein [Fundidesulfovibrio putealis]
MYMKVFPHGQGGGDGPTHYLVRPDYPDRDKHPPEVLRGDPDLTRELIDSLDTKWKFTAGVLSWHPDESVTPEQEKRVMDDFEAVAFAGLEPDQRNVLWVRHRHARHHELHFVIPRVELSSGKAFNPCPPGWQKHFDVFRDLHNNREGWARPEDPARARLHTPEHADLRTARLIRWGKTPGKDERVEAKDAIHAYLVMKIEEGQVVNRADVLTVLKEADLEINRAGKDYITVKDPVSGEKLRLKGGIYAEHWQLAGIPGGAHEVQGRTGPAATRSPDPATVRRLERELAAIIDRRAQYNRGRYPGRAWTIGGEHRLTLPDLEQDLRQEVAASPAPGLGPSNGNRPGRLGPAGNAPEQGHGLAERDSGPTGRQNGLGSDRRTIERTYLGLEAPGESGRAVHHSAAEDDPQNGMDRWQTASREAGVSYDRNRTPSHGHPGHVGAGTTPSAGKPRNDLDWSTADHGKACGYLTSAPAPGRPPERPTTRISAVLAALERYTREFGALAGTIELHLERQAEKVKHSHSNELDQ